MIDYVEPLAEQVKGMEGVSEDFPGKHNIPSWLAHRIFYSQPGFACYITFLSDFTALREQAVAKNAALQESAAPVLKVIADPAVVDRLKGAVDKLRNMDLLEKEYGVSCVDDVKS